MTSIQYSEDPKLRTAQRIVFWTVIGLGDVAAFGLLFGVLIQFLWNATLVSLFDFPICVYLYTSIHIELSIRHEFEFNRAGQQASALPKLSHMPPTIRLWLSNLALTLLTYSSRVLGYADIHH